MVGDTINLEEFPEHTRENLETTVHPTTEKEKEDSPVALPMMEDITSDTPIPNNQDANIGPVLHSFEHEGQHYEIRSYIEDGQTSNQNDDNPTTLEFQEV